MSAKHTPGPWIVGHKLQNSIVTDTLQHGELAVADVNIIRAESAANARLIAAAPDLLEFAEEVRKSGDTRLASMAVAAIARAIG